MKIGLFSRKIVKIIVWHVWHHMNASWCGFHCEFVANLICFGCAAYVQCTLYDILSRHSICLDLSIFLCVEFIIFCSLSPSPSVKSYDAYKVYIINTTHNPVIHFLRLFICFLFSVCFFSFRKSHDLIKYSQHWHNHIYLVVYTIQRLSLVSE